MIDLKTCRPFNCEVGVLLVFDGESPLAESQLAASRAGDFEPEAAPSSTDGLATDPELKGGGVPLGSRRWCSGPIQQKKRPDLGLACHVEPDRPNSCCCIGQECAVPKITCDVSDRKPAPTCQEKKFLEFFLSSRPEHNQKPPTDTANRHCAFIPTRRKIAVWPQGAQSTAPLARGRSHE